jgi:predicted esterase
MKTSRGRLTCAPIAPSTGRMIRRRSGALALALFPLLGACSREKKTDPPVPALSRETSAVTRMAWCGEGWRSLDEGACLALPDRFAEPASVVVFAHGMIAPDAVPTEEQATLLAAARARGFAVLFPRGKAGLCTWEPGVVENLCWPTRQEVVDEAGPGILAGWDRAQAQAEAQAGVRFARRYLFGFSNGGYFVAFLTVEGRYRVDGAGLVGAGRSAVDESLTGAARPPFYLAVGEQEADVTRQNAATLAQVLERGGWKTEHVVHPGRGHELHEDDLEAAWTLWGR